MARALYTSERGVSASDRYVRDIRRTGRASAGARWYRALVSYPAEETIRLCVRSVAAADARGPSDILTVSMRVESEQAGSRSREAICPLCHEKIRAGISLNVRPLSSRPAF